MRPISGLRRQPSNAPGNRHSRCVTPRRSVRKRLRGAGWAGSCSAWPSDRESRREPGCGPKLRVDDDALSSSAPLLLLLDHASAAAARAGSKASSSTAPLRRLATRPITGGRRSSACPCVCTSCWPDLIRSKPARPVWSSTALSDAPRNQTRSASKTHALSRPSRLSVIVLHEHVLPAASTG
eukprot:2988150-Prymnesium_polylepis.2